ncbi:unnamed protein product [Cylicostephanus goldi]|uniref:Uncharacterized protein n=1 Tax=Cylicostephanus goldi TaxID=71465 RepID=A0A3P6RMJ2_CYLGO|nr:unnamed protein product [Cylicostephanus goldi]
METMKTSSRDVAMSQPTTAATLATRPKMVPTKTSEQKLQSAPTIAPAAAVAVRKPAELNVTMLPPIPRPPPPSSPTPPPKDPTPPPLPTALHMQSSPPPSPTPPQLPTPVTPTASAPCPEAVPCTSGVSTPPREPSPPRIHLPTKVPMPRMAAPIFVDVQSEIEVLPEEHEYVPEQSGTMSTSRFQFCFLLFCSFTVVVSNLNAEITRPCKNSFFSKIAEIT